MFSTSEKKPIPLVEVEEICLPIVQAVVKEEIALAGGEMALQVYFFNFFKQDFISNLCINRNIFKNIMQINSK